MKVLSVRQPHATLLALNLKLNETRSRAAKYRGPIAIHASKIVDLEACRREPIKSVLAKYGYDETNLPTGCIISIGNLVDCQKVIEDADYCALLEDGQVVEGNEYDFGNYEVDRFAWAMADMREIKSISTKGQLGLWNWEGDYEWQNNMLPPKDMN